MLLHDLDEKGLLDAPKWLADNCPYLCRMGSDAYGVSEDGSDSDMYGYVFPPKGMVFPHLEGEILGFGRHKNRFEQWQQHHVIDNDKQYDFSIYSIVKYFSLCMENNPNMIDSLFVPRECIVHITPIGNLIRENRGLFLHKGSYHKFLGYAHSMLHKIRVKTPEKGSKRSVLIEKYGFDVKYAYHLVRLCNECEQILSTGDLDLRKGNEQLKAIRRGEMTEKQIVEWFSEQEKTLEVLYRDSALRNVPDEPSIKALLVKCLGLHYGDLSNCVVDTDKYHKAVEDIRKILDNVK